MQEGIEFSFSEKQITKIKDLFLEKPVLLRTSLA